MKYYAVAIGAIALAIGQLRADGADPAGSDEISGVWKIVSVSENGKNVAEEAEKNDPSTVRFLHGKMSVADGLETEDAEGTQSDERLTYRLTVDRSPKWIDLEYDTGDDKPPQFTRKGIFRVEGDELTLCLTHDARDNEFDWCWIITDEDRPTDFDPKDHDLFVLKRAPEDKSRSKP